MLRRRSDMQRQRQNMHFVAERMYSYESRIIVLVSRASVNGLRFETLRPSIA